MSLYYNLNLLKLVSNFEKATNTIDSHERKDNKILEILINIK